MPNFVAILNTRDRNLSDPQFDDMYIYLCMIIFSTAAPLSGWLSDSYSARVMSLVGGVIACVGIAATGFAPNIWIAVLTFGGLFGKYTFVSLFWTHLKTSDGHNFFNNGPIFKQLKTSSM